MLCLVAANAIFAPPREQDVLIPARDGRQLAGTLTLPAVGHPPFPVAISLTGSGAHHRDGNRAPAHPYRPFREIANALADKGIAMLRMDDRGVGASTGDANATTGDDVADDVRVAIAWLRGRKEMDAARVALIGHSFGGAVAPMVAGDDARIAALVLMAAPARSFRETMRYQHGRRIQADPGIAPDDREAALARAMARQEQNAAASEELWRPWLQNKDLLPAVRRVSCPVLILHGTSDQAVPPADALALFATLREASNHRVTLKILESMNHHFNIDPVGATNRYDQLPSQNLAREFLKTLSAWLAETLARP